MDEFIMRFSIIVPIYNAEATIERCIKSVIAQKCADWELLLIDDGSTDSSYYFCDSFSNQNKRIKCFHIPNGGASSARNYGISKASGDYLLFLDADDTISDCTLEILCDRIDKYNCPDLIEFQLTYYGPTGFINIQGMNYKEQIVDRTFILKLIPILAGYHNNSELRFDIFNVLRCVKRKIVIDNNIKFNESIHRWEDLLFAICIYLHCNNALMLPIPLYNYYGKIGGGLGGKYCPGTFDYVVLAYQIIDELLKDICEPMNQQAISTKLNLIYRCIVEIDAYEKNMIKKSEIKRIVQNEYFRKLLYKCRTNKGIEILRLFVFSEVLLYYSLRCFLLCRRIVNKLKVMINDN